MTDKNQNSGQLSFLDRLSNIEEMAKRILGRDVVEEPPAASHVEKSPVEVLDSVETEKPKKNGLEKGLKLFSDPEFREKIRKASIINEEKESKERSHLEPVRHPNKDFFIADIFDAVPKDDMASMEHPLFALKAGDKKLRTYEHNGNVLMIKPGYHGMATIHDKDVWIYCISQLMDAKNKGKEISRTVRFRAYDFLVSTNRGVGGNKYERLKNSLERLQGTVIQTSIEAAGYREEQAFGMIDGWRIVEKSQDEETMVALEVTLPAWVMASIYGSNVLTISQDYFRLRKPLDRRIYELARKHCGKQGKWRISLELLWKKSGSTAILRKFRSSIRSLAESDELPDYNLKFDDRRDQVVFYSRSLAGALARAKDVS